MAPSFYTDLDVAERGQLLKIARQSIESGLASGAIFQLDMENLPDVFSAQPGVFVTLMHFERLRGCVGSLETVHPLAQSVANSAFNAAFHDSRFPRLVAEEFEDIRIEVSVLSELKPLIVADRNELLSRLDPGEDGLLLEDGRYCATFLPKVWDMVSDPAEFLDHLLVKAGLTTNYWSETIQFKHYRALSFHELEQAG